MIEPVFAGEYPVEEIPADDIAFAEDLGLVAVRPGGLGIANPIYREVILRELEPGEPVFQSHHSSIFDFSSRSVTTSSL